MKYHELEIKETTQSDRSASYLDILLSFDANGHLNTLLYEKRDDFSFHKTNFPFMSSNIPSSPAYGAFQLIRYARACSKYYDFIVRVRRLASKLFVQGYISQRLKSSLSEFFGRYGYIIKEYQTPLTFCIAIEWLSSSPNKKYLPDMYINMTPRQSQMELLRLVLHAI